MSNPICPKCNIEMRLQNGKFGAFFGCPNWKRCGTKPVNASRWFATNPQTTTIKTEYVEFPPSDKQIDIVKFVQNEVKNLIIFAGPGCGKSDTLRRIAKSLPGTAKILVLVFNKKPQIELSSKIDFENVTVKTFHSFCLDAARRQFGKFEIDTKNLKNEMIFKSILDESNDDDSKKALLKIKTDIFAVVGLMFNTLQSANDICKLKGFDSEIENHAARIFNQSLQNKSLITFDEMIYFAGKGITLLDDSYTHILMDEAQDSNNCQIESMKRLNGQKVFVGDKLQSIYGFRGANSNAMDLLQSNFSCYSLPLDIAYRLTSLHVEMINTSFGTNLISGNNREGTINYKNDVEFLDNIPEKSLVLCRNNAPMIKPVFALLSRGIKASIAGRDILGNLHYIINTVIDNYNVKNDDIGGFLQGLQEYAFIKASKIKNAMTLQEVNDKIQSIEAIAQECNSIKEIFQKLDTLFSDSENEGITFSTVHKAKGMENDNVYILYPSLMPSKRAKSEEEIAQEINIQFVAYSRSKQNLTFVNESK